MSSNYNKFKNILSEEIKFEETQEKLHAKHKDIPDDKIIIEKSNTFKFTISFIASVFKIASEIILVILASIGIISLVYKEPREDLIIIFKEIYKTILSMF